MKKGVKILIIVLSIIIILFLIYQIQHYYLVKILDKVNDIDSIKYQTLFSSHENVFSNQKIYREGEGEEIKLRIEDFKSELDKEEASAIHVVNSKDDLSYWYFPDRNTLRKTEINPDFSAYEGSREGLIKTNKEIEEGKALIVGISSVDGKKCLVIKQLTEYYGSFGVVTHWIWVDYGLPIKGSTADNDLEIIRKNIEINVDIPDSLFILPQDVKIVD